MTTKKTKKTTDTAAQAAAEKERLTAKAQAALLELADRQEEQHQRRWVLLILCFAEARRTKNHRRHLQ